MPSHLLYIVITWKKKDRRIYGKEELEERLKMYILERWYSKRENFLTLFDMLVEDLKKMLRSILLKIFFLR